MNVISIDVGGTKTQAVLYDENGQVLQELSLSSCHFMNAQEEEIKVRLKQCLLDDEAEIVIGYAGYERNEELRQKIDTVVQEVFQGHPVHIMSDVKMALLGSLEGQDGILVILGTGSVVMKKKQDTVTCTGGWGYLLGDEGSGYSIGLKALQKFVKQADGRMPKDELYIDIMELYDMKEPAEIIARCMNEGKPDRTGIARIAKLICTEKCSTYYGILLEAAQEASQMISTVYEPGDKVVVTGGMTHSNSYMTILADTMHSFCQAEVTQHEPVYGGYIYFKQQHSRH